MRDGDQVGAQLPLPPALSVGNVHAPALVAVRAGAGEKGGGSGNRVWRRKGRGPLNMDKHIVAICPFVLIVESRRLKII